LEGVARGQNREAAEGLAGRDPPDASVGNGLDRSAQPMGIRFCFKKRIFS